jgi:hypothetical protein
MDTQIGEPSSISAERNDAVPPELTSRNPALAATAWFLRQCWLRFLAISVAVTIPCFWHQRIEAGDLPSHVYNAWLAQLIERGQAPGLWVARQWNNVLFDFALVKLANVLGLRAAEKLVVPAAVLVFFWGAFALVCSIARPATLREVPWFVLPCLGMFSYGWTFQMGFMNYYLSIGLAFFSLALLHRGQGRERILIAAFVPLIWLAHPLGLALLLSAGAYMLFVGRMAPRYLFTAAALVIDAVRFYINTHYEIASWAGARVMEDGSDQLLLYGPRYVWLGHVLQGLVCGFLLLDVMRRPKTPGWWTPYLLPLQLYALTLLAVILLPSFIRLPQYEVPLGLLTERLTSVSAILICCLLGLMRPRKWHLLSFAALAVVFSFFLYRDTATLNHMENQVEDYVRLIPPGRRVLATIGPFPGSRVFIQHIVDRACVEQCFSYENYEPSSGQFRVRSNEGNPFVLGAKDSDAAEGGAYVVQPKDLPVYEIYQCNLNMIELCIHELAAGEANGAVGVHPSHY